MTTDEERARKYLEKMTWTELNQFMTKHDCHTTRLLWWDEEQWPTKEEYEEALRQDHISRLSPSVKFSSPSQELIEQT